MNRHGVLLPRDDGVRAKCMGPGECPFCNEDAADASMATVIDYITAEVARRWSMPNADLTSIMTWAVKCVTARSNVLNGAPTDGLVRISVTLPEVGKELQLMAALDQLCDYKMVSPQETARAVRWLGTKYDPQFTEVQS